MANDFGNISLDEAIPRLVANYHRGKLVPFTGAGISAGSVPLWQKMVSTLYAQQGIPFPNGQSLTTQQLIQYSDAIVTALARESREQFIAATEECCGYVGRTEPPVTAQCTALAALWWPLIITTNYDRLLVNAYLNHKLNGKRDIKVFGRNPTDCHSLLSMLNTGAGTAYWALQGYFGDSENRNNLKDEIVLGYRQYRSATYNNSTFRAVFGEIYRNHSLLFLGSGLSEDYFMGLFGEVLEKFGRNPYTHCALFSEQDAGNIDHKFLLTRMNIVAVFYPDKGEKYAGLPMALNKLAVAIQSSGTRLWKLGYGNRSLSALNNKQSPLELEIVAGTMPEEKEGECLVFSGGIKMGELLLSEQGQIYIGKKDEAGYNNLRFVRLKELRCWQYNSSNIYAAVARNDSGGSSHDARDLRMVEEAFRDTIIALYDKYQTINIMLLAAGKGRIFPPVHSLIAMIRGYRWAVSDLERKNLATEGGSVKIHVVDPSVLAYVRRNPLEIEEIISCDDLRLNIEIQGEQEIERFHMYLAGGEKLASVSKFFSIKEEFWNVRVEPVPYLGQQLTPDSQEQLWALGLIPGSTIVYSRNNSKGSVKK